MAKFLPLLFAVLTLTNLVFATAPENIKSWQKVISVLNQPDLSRVDPTPFTNAVDDDLLKLNEQELTAIEKKWEKKNTKDKNVFFHDEIQALNQTTFSKIENAKAQSIKSKNYRAAARKALAKIKNNALTSPDSVYQFKDGDQIGFCFSRALLVHYFLLKEGVPQEAIAKIFNVGELMVKGIFWKFHVAILLRDPREGFIVVDALENDVVPYKDWIKTNSNYEIKRPLSRSRFYVTSPQKFLPSFGAYSLEQFNNSNFSSYFDELIKYLN